jgi:hypothetical protein
MSHGGGRPLDSRETDSQARRLQKLHRIFQLKRQAMASNAQESFQRSREIIDPYMAEVPCTPGLFQYAATPKSHHLPGDSATPNHSSLLGRCIAENSDGMKFRESFQRPDHYVHAKDIETAMLL